MTWRVRACAQLQDYTVPQKRLVEQKELRYKGVEQLVQSLQGSES